MKCVKCDKEATVKVQNLNACKNCFLEIIQKRVRKELRVNELISKGDNILVIDNNTAEAKVSDYLLRQIIEDLPVEITVKKRKWNLGEELSGDYDKIIIPWNADLEDEYFLECVFTDKEPEYLGHYDEGRYVKLLLPVTEEEVKTFAEIKGVKFEKRNKKSPVKKMLNKLEEEYPSIKFSLLQSIKHLDKKFYK